MWERGIDTVFAAVFAAVLAICLASAIVAMFWPGPRPESTSIRHYVGFDGSFRGGEGSVSSAPVLIHSPYKKPRPNASYYRSYRSNNGLPKCERLLPLSGFSGIPLGAQIVIFTLFGAALLFGTAFGLACLLGIVYRDGPRRRWLYWLLIILCTPIGASMYSLASMGDWRAIWMLCDFPGY